MKRPRAALPRLVLGLLAAAAAVWLARNRYHVDPALIESTIQGVGLWAPLAHIAIFITLGTRAGPSSRRPMKALSILGDLLCCDEGC